MLSFHVSGKQAFEISIGDVSQTAIQGKSDCVLEFHREDNPGANSTEVPPLPNRDVRVAAMMTR